MNSDQNGTYGQRLGRIERATELPMLILSFVYLPLFVVGYLRDVPTDVRDVARLLGVLVIIAFAVELAVKVAVASRRPAYLAAHWLDAVIVLVPFLRPLRIVRVLRILPFFMKGVAGARTILGRYSGVYVLFAGTLSVLLSAFLVFVFERGAGGTIQDFNAALWWAIQTVTTVGYGDVVPVTTGGRVVAGLLMVAGITLFGALTASVAAYFVHKPDRDEPDDTAKILARFASLEARLGSLESILKERDRDAENRDR